MHQGPADRTHRSEVARAGCDDDVFGKLASRFLRSLALDAKALARWARLFRSDARFQIHEKIQTANQGWLALIDRRQAVFDPTSDSALCSFKRASGLIDIVVAMYFNPSPVRAVAGHDQTTL